MGSRIYSVEPLRITNNLELILDQDSETVEEVQLGITGGGRYYLTIEVLHQGLVSDGD